MRKFICILAFVVFFALSTLIGILAAERIWRGQAANKEQGEVTGSPTVAVVVAVACSCAGALAGWHSAKATAKLYHRDQPMRTRPL